MRYDHYGMPAFGGSMYDNSRVEPESWEEQFTEQLAEQVERHDSDEQRDSSEPTE